MIGSNKNNKTSKFSREHLETANSSALSYYGGKKNIFSFEKRFCNVLESALKITKLFRRGYSNALDLDINHHDLTFDNLPEAFHGKRILFLSDLHLGGMDETPGLLFQKIQSLEIDLCVFGGDFKYSWADSMESSIKSMRHIIKAIEAPLGIYGVLGNHDSYKMIPEFKEMGLNILVNASNAIHHEGQSIHLVGVDDPFYFRCHDMEAAFSAVPENEFIIFTAHTPQLFEEASSRLANIYLCGHTHNGQIQIPFWGPIVTNTHAPRPMVGGVWKHNEMTGYTTSGVGTSGARVRFLCPPEISVLTLKRNDMDSKK